MMNDKKIKIKKFNDFLKTIGKCDKCLYNHNCPKSDHSLINFYKDILFAKNIPSIWTDWYNHLDAKIMIIGQDWGPFIDMQKLNREYIKRKTMDNWQRLIEAENSETKKRLTNFITISSNGKIDNLDEFFITNAIMCARKGANYRGNNINLKASTLACSKYLAMQIDIVNPEIILTLGYYPLLSLSKIFGFEIPSSLTSCIDKMPVIKVTNRTIIPLYHPVAQIKKERQLEQYTRIWEHIVTK